MKNYLILSIAATALGLFGIITRIAIALIANHWMIPIADLDIVTFSLVNIPLLLSLMLLSLSGLLWVEDMIAYAKEMDL
uniref:hypothetical protein n=1 Tax=Streptococcus pluranimalium TaxID=82348 RepID=UPI003F68D4BD